MQTEKSLVRNSGVGGGGQIFILIVCLICDISPRSNGAVQIRLWVWSPLTGALFSALSSAPRLRPALSETLSSALLLVRASALLERAARIRTLFSTHISRTKNQPKEEVFGTDIPRTSGGHARSFPGPKLRSGPSKSWQKKNRAFLRGHQ